MEEVLGATTDDNTLQSNQTKDVSFENGGTTQRVKSPDPQRKQTITDENNNNRGSWFGWLAGKGNDDNSNSSVHDQLNRSRENLGSGKNFLRESTSKQGKNYMQFRKSSKAIITKLPFDGSWMSAIQLSLWLNVSGPKIEQVWNCADLMTEEIQQYIARRTLCGEISRDPTDAPLETKFHLLPEIGYIVTAVIFTIPYNGTPTRASLCLLSRRENLNRYLLIHSVVEDRLLYLVHKLRSMFTSMPTEALPSTTEQLKIMLPPLDCIYNSSLPPVRFAYTAFAEVSSTIDVDFLGRAITSHLQTHGSTVVIGENKELVNCFVNSLALFLNSNEKKRSSLIVPNRGYVPNLLLQGLSGTLVSNEQIMQSILPTTLVDLDQYVIKQSYLFHEYTVLRKESLAIEVEKLVYGKSKRNLWDDLFKQVKVTAPCVEKLLTEAYRLPNYLREGFIVHSVRGLIRKAVLLVKYVEVELRENVTGGNLEDKVVKRIRMDLDLHHEADFSVLLAIAEKLFPGIYVSLAGDPATIAEKVIEIFE